jgi:hypothetical protein
MCVIIAIEFSLGEGFVDLITKCIAGSTIGGGSVTKGSRDVGSTVGVTSTLSGWFVELFVHCSRVANVLRTTDTSLCDRVAFPGWINSTRNV